MSTDPPAPRTRAEMRAMREAEAAAAASAESVEPVELAPLVVSGPEFRPEVSSGDAGEPAEPVELAPLVVSEPDLRPEVSTGDAAEPAEPVELAPPVASDAELRPEVSSGDAEPEPAPAPAPKRPRSRFGIMLVAVLGVLALVGGGFAAASLFQGPRLSGVQVNATEAIELSGSRVILTTNEALAEIDPAQVTVTPEVPFTVDAGGRDIGIRFTVPLDDGTDYTITVAGVTGTGGGPVADLTTTFTTPASEVFLLTRDAEGDDKIFRTDLTGEQPTLVYSAERIDDFRATSTQLVVAVEDDEGSKILVMNRDGSDERELALPGDGVVTGVQVSDRGGLVGYSYSDQELSETSGRASVLVTQRLDGTGEPRIVEVSGEEASVAEWHFVPDSAAVLFIDFAGALALEDLSGDAGIQALGNAMTIQGVSRGTYTAIIERTDGTVVELNLADGSEAPLAASDPDYGTATTITPYPGGTLRHIVARDENGFPTGQAVIRVADDGTAEPLVEVETTDSILQTCASPSGQYAAVVVAPDLTNNPYDDLLAPLPQTLHTHLIDMETGEEMVALTGFDISWCQSGPIY